LTLVVVLPTPPFWFATQNIFAMNALIRQRNNNTRYGLFNKYSIYR
jgi:hypothetical protein